MCGRIASSSAAVVVALAACTSSPATIPGQPPPPTSLLTPVDDTSAARLEVVSSAGRPGLTLLSRDGDPSPAVAVTFLTSEGPVATTGLAGVMEARVRARGFEPDLRVDRDAFTLRATFPDPERVTPFLAAIAAASSQPIAVSASAASPEIALAVERLRSLKRNPLEDPALDDVVACTGALGVTAQEPSLDATTPAGIAALEGARRRLDVSRIAIASVGPVAFNARAAEAMARTTGWASSPGSSGAPPSSAGSTGSTRAGDWPEADAVSVYRTAGARSKITIAARLFDPAVATAAAARAGALDSPLVTRLRALPHPWRVRDVAGVARAQGGCVAVEIEPADEVPPSVDDAAFAADIARREIIAEAALGAPKATATRQILEASDARDAASLEAWWSLSRGSPGAPTRWTTALALPTARGATDAGPSTAPLASAFRDALARTDRVDAHAERRTAIERGQGELWILLASPCGVAEESDHDAGLGALAMLAASEPHVTPQGVAIEPWITPDGLGVIAHASPASEREGAFELARRVADAVAQRVVASQPGADALRSARFTALEHLEHGGYGGLALSAIAEAAAPSHPSWVDPFGLAARVAAASTEAIRFRAEALALGPLRVAVLANTDAAQANAAADDVDRWLAPVPLAARACKGAAPSVPRAGRSEMHLGEGATLAQGLFAIPLPGPGWREPSELTAILLDGPNGLLAQHVADAAVSARVEGGGRVPLLVIDVRAPVDTLATAMSEARSVVLGLALANGVPEPDLARGLLAWDDRERRALSDPRGRLVNLWLGRKPPVRPTAASLRAFLASTVRESALITVEARGSR